MMLRSGQNNLLHVKQRIPSLALSGEGVGGNQDFLKFVTANSTEGGSNFNKNNTQPLSGMLGGGIPKEYN